MYLFSACPDPFNPNWRRSALRSATSHVAGDGNCTGGARGVSVSYTTLLPNYATELYVLVQRSNWSEAMEQREPVPRFDFSMSCLILSPEPTFVPTPEPTPLPTSQPTTLPTFQPTALPTPDPSKVPSPLPTSEPSFVPTSEPTAGTVAQANS